MSDEISQVSFDISGEAAVESAIELLESHAGDREFDHVSVKLAKMGQSHGANQSQKSVTDYRESSTSDEPPQRIQRGTSHHAVLSGLSELADEMPVSTRRILDVANMPEGTAYAAMSELSDRGLVERTDEKNENNSYEYRITDAGENELNRLGVIDHNAQ